MLIADGNPHPQPFRTVAQIAEDAREAIAKGESQIVARRKKLS